MKILILSSFFPYPLFSGGQVRLYNILRNLGKKHEITLVCEIRRKEDLKNVAEIEKYCKKVLTAIRDKQWSLKNILKSGFSSFSFLMVGHQNRYLYDVLKKELESQNYDLIAVETFYVMHNLPLTNVPVILTEYNIEYQIYQSFVKNFWLFSLKPLLYFDVLKMRFWERKYWQKASQVIAVSESDQKIIEQTTHKKVELIPNGVDGDYFGEVKKIEPKDPTVVFCGSFRWLQNRDAAAFLLEKLWPQIKNSVTGAKLWIVGNDAHKFLKNINDPQVIVQDSVKDIREVYTKGTLLLAPLRIGGGIKFKIVESMASGLPVVTTPKGVEGLGSYTNGIVVCEEEKLVKRTIELLSDKNKRAEISRQEKDFVRKNFDWEDISAKLEKIYENWH